MPTLLARRCCSLSLLVLWLIDTDADADTNADAVAGADANADADAGGHPAHRLKRKQSYKQTLTTETKSNEAANDLSILIEGRVYRFNPPTLPAGPTRALHANQTSPPLRGRWKDCSDDIVYSTADLWTSMLPVYRWLLNTCVGQGGVVGKGEGRQSGL